MGKVRKLRKKYGVFVANKNVVKGYNGNDDGPSLDDVVINSRKDFSRNFDQKSTCSISKSIKSHLSGQSITKKDKQRLRHALFLEKLQASAETLNKKKKHKMQKRIVLKDDLPLFADPVNKQEKRKRFALQNFNSPIQKSSSRKGSTKHRNVQMIRDVNLLHKLIKDETLTENPHRRIQTHTLEKLSQECLDVEINS